MHHLRLALLLTPALLAACGGGEPAPAGPAPQPVRTVTVGAQVLPESSRATGLVAARDEVRLAFKVGGVIARMTADEGDRVRAGTLLAEIAPAEIDAQVVQAREQLAKAERDLQRLEDLYARGLVARQPVQDARTAVDTSRAQLDSAEFNRRHARIEAPGDGTVLRRLAEPGELVSAGTPVFLFAAGQRGWQLRVAVADRVAMRLRAGDPARVQLDAWPDRTFTGRIERIAAASDAGTGTLDVEIGFASEGLRMASGLVGHAVLPLRSAQDGVLAVPVGAILEADGDRAHVFVLDATGERVRRADIRTGGIRGEQVVVREGLAAGDRVVSEGGAWLEDGSAVAVQP